MKYLLPYYFKKIGLFSAPLGLFIWLSIQFGGFSRLLTSVFPNDGYVNLIRNLTFITATLSLIGFLGGVIFLCFSKEKIEDERIQKIRVESFQVSALCQILFVFLMFVGMIIFGSPHEGFLMLFFIISLSLFWIIFMIRFSYKAYIGV